MKPIHSFDVVIPVYNEAPSLAALLDRLHHDLQATKREWRVVFVDDGSRDGSWDILRQAALASDRITAIRLTRNYGQHPAILAGFAHCKADAVVTLDADLQNPPSEIGKLLDALDDGFDVAGGWRVLRQDSAMRRAASWLMNRMVSKATGVALRDYGCMLRAFRIGVVRRMTESEEISSYVPALAHAFTDRVTEVRVEHAARHAGESRYSLLSLTHLLLDLLTGFSMAPLRAVSLVGSAAAFGGAALGIFILVMRLVRGSAWAAEGTFTLFAVLFFLVGAQLLALGVLGEYIGRIYNEVRRRPRYAVREIVGS